MMKIIAIIHARGGSKRIPLKNIKFLNGKPLIAYPIELAKSISKGGWFGNLWNPDIGEMIEFPVAAMITLIGLEADVDINTGVDKGVKKPLLAQAKRRLKEIKNEKENTIEGDVEEAVIVEDKPIIGIMSRGV